MKHIIVNLKRFDIPKAYHGVSECEPSAYIDTILLPLVEPLKKYPDLSFIIYPPEAYLIRACELVKESPNIRIGCQANHYEDVSKEGNFGAFTSLRPASAMKAIGAQSSLIGHFEERRHLNTLYQLAGVNDPIIVNQVLNKEIQMAQKQGMDVCYCIGEAAEQLAQWDTVLLQQLSIGLAGVDHQHVIIGYEPLWSIGPGKQPADQAYIEKVIRLVKTFDPELRVIYGGGVKLANAAMLAGIESMDGGLIGLTNFQDHLGFHPDEFLAIIERYHQHLKQ